MNAGKITTFTPDSCIYPANDPDSDSVYIIQSGKVELRYNDPARTHYTQSAGKGDILGFISSLSRRARLSTALATAKTTILQLSSREFLTLLSRNQKIALKVIDIFARTLTFYNETLFQGIKRNLSAPAPAAMLSLARFYSRENPQIAGYIYSRFLTDYADHEQHQKAKDELSSLRLTTIQPVTLERNQNGTIACLPKQVIFCEEETGDTLYVILSGRVEIVKVKDNSSVLLSILHEGDIFGELAIASNRPRSATAVSADHTILLPVTRDSLSNFMHEKPIILQKIFSSICERIWFTALRSEIHLYSKPITKLYTFLVNKIQELRIPLNQKYAHVFDFDIRALLKMTGLRSIELHDPGLTPFLTDKNISMHFGQITINNVSDLVARTRQYKREDGLITRERQPRTNSPEISPPSMLSSTGD